jgi:hypothetical protein
MTYCLLGNLVQGDATWNHNMFDLYVKHGEGDGPILCECIHF